jgi:hypothetical protein
MLSGAAVAAAAVIVPLSVAMAAPTTADATTVNAGQYAKVNPTRILDTRYGIGAPKAPVGQGQKVVLTVTGVGTIPATGVSAVVLNVTETNATRASFLTVFPDGGSVPTASNLNFAANSTQANSVTVQVPASGKVDIYNSYGSVNVIADVTGYFIGDDTAGTGGDYTALTSTRLLDSRDPGLGPLNYGDWYDTWFSFGLDPDSHITAVAVNITAVTPTAPGYFTTWNGQGAIPNTSVLNFPAGRNVPNFAIVPTSKCSAVETVDVCGGADWANAPTIAVASLAHGSTNVIVDLVGYFDDGTLKTTIGDGARFHPLAPQRIVDTRSSLGGVSSIGPNATATFAAPGTVADAGTLALSLNATAYNPSLSTFMTFWPGGTRPTGSTLNPAAHQTVANAAITQLSNTNTFNVYNNVGTTGLIVDVNGSYELPAAAAAPAAKGTTAARTTPTLKVAAQPARH